MFVEVDYSFLSSSFNTQRLMDADEEGSYPILVYGNVFLIFIHLFVLIFVFIIFLLR